MSAPRSRSPRRGRDVEKAQRELAALSAFSEPPPAVRRKPAPAVIPNRGSKAWELLHGHELEDDLNALHVHSITDRVALSSYLPGAKRFYQWAHRTNRRVGTLAELDRTLALYLSSRCYVHHDSYERGVASVYGVMYVRPELQDAAPLTRGALSAWKRLHVAGEGQPVPWEGVCVIAEQMKTQGDTVASDVCLVAADCFLRESDWALIHPDDVSYSARYGVSIQLGAPERGATTKTGPRQGVRPDRPVVERIVLAYKEDAKKRGRHRLFPLTPQQFYAAWVKACAALQYNPGPPHCDTREHLMTRWRTPFLASGTVVLMPFV